MSIGSMKDLYNASKGSFKPRVIEEPWDPTKFSNTLTGYSAAGTSAQSPFSGNVKPTSQLASLLAAPRSSAGLSSKGKYGGFYSATDLQSAIEGSAMNFADLAPQLRSKADTYLTGLNEARGDAETGAQGTVRTGMGFNPQAKASAGNVRMFEETSQNRDPLLRQYADQLGKWMKTNVAPGFEYLNTAQQIEGTPVSTLAEQIATRQYGMNPDLAAGKFAGIDETYFKRTRDRQYMKDYGQPYEQYMSGLNEGNKLYTADINAAQMGIESLTGFKSSAIESLTGRNPIALYNDVLRKKNIEYKDQNTTYSTDGETLTKLVLEKIANGETDNVFKLGESMKAENPAVASFVYSLLYLAGMKDSKITNDLYLGGLISQ
jgi:hypothetical protein